jgi:hypothetical protein
VLRVPKGEIQQDFQYFLPRGYAHENGCGGPRYEKGCCIACDPCFDIEVNLVFRPKKTAISTWMFDIDIKGRWRRPIHLASCIFDSRIISRGGPED